MVVSGARRAREFAESDDRGWGPILGPAARDRYYSARLRQLGGLEVEEAEARALWWEVVRHRREMQLRLGRDVGQQVALLDYVINVRQRHAQPQIIEKSALEAIEQLAIEDALTGVYNRRYFESALERETERCHRYRGSLSLLMLDLDHFKSMNDQRGHPEGDRVLQETAWLILHHVRAPDIVCRCGGDEFGVVLPDTPEADAVAVAERVRSAIEAAFLDTGLGAAEDDGREPQATRGGAASITASGGISTLSAELASPDRLIAAADHALYCAKRGGGNRVLVALSPDTRASCSG